jgi:DNA primase
VTSTADKKVFNCRGCAKAGDVIELVKFLDGCDFTRAVEKLTGEKPPEDKNGGGGKWTLLAEYVYRDANGAPFLRVRKCLDENGKRQYPQAHWDGKAWAKGKPLLDDGKPAPKIPYRLSELLATPLTAIVYHVEGEKDCEALAKLGFVATTASEGASAKWDPALTQYFRDRHVVIVVDADAPGRKHGQKVAKALNGVAASLRVLDLYAELSDGSDVSDWLIDDPAGVRLAKLAKEAPLWEPGEPDGGEPEPSGGDEDDAELERLAKMSLLD